GRARRGDVRSRRGGMRRVGHRDAVLRLQGWDRLTDLMPEEHHEGSCIVVVATDAPLLPHQLRRVAERAGMGLARGGSHASNTSGEQLLAFSTAARVPRDGRPFAPAAIADGPRAGTILSANFRATVKATNEAIRNALIP